ncbi:response regulator [Sulfuriflexus mobilis]|uniref:response regulator n=1 Tax=Sulfuriflexus mobilis TaxID=1811807 RepID=UPI000F838EB0|nr:response regulator [Sulfuriflexus mobilis]
MTDKHLILYVEDNPANMRLVDQILKQFPSVELAGAETAEDGIEMAVNSQPALILMDINLPGMDGYQALEELRKCTETRHIPVVAISANAMSSDVQRGLDMGFDGYLTKPLNLQEFMSMIRMQLQLD